MKIKFLFQRKLLFCIVVLITMIPLLAGCWSSHEINDLVIVNEMGIDENNGNFDITLSIIKPNSLFSTTSTEENNENQQNNYLIVTATGNSILDAISQLSRSLPGRIYMGHLDLVVIGENAARDKMESSLDILKRIADFRPNIHLLVAKGSAKDMLRLQPQLNITLGMVVRDLSKSNRYSSTKMVQDISQFLKQSSNPGSDAYTGVAVSNVSNDVDSDLLGIEGTAVFKKGHLVGFLDHKQTRGLLWLNGKLKNEVIVLNCNESGNNHVSLKVYESHANLSPRFEGGKLTMELDVHVNADLEEVTCTHFKYNTAEFDQLNHQLQQFIQQETTDVLNLVKNQWQTDIFNFGQAIYRKYPRQWKMIAPHWRNDELQKMPVTVKVSVNITDHGMLKDPINSDESR